MKKILVPGLIAGVVTLVVTMILSNVFMFFPGVAEDYIGGLMRPWSDPLMMIFFLYPFVQGIIFAWAWNKTKSLFAGSTAKRGAQFGAAVWFISGFPGMFVTYTSFVVGFLTVLSWAIGGLIAAILSGMIFARMNRV